MKVTKDGCLAFEKKFGMDNDGLLDLRKMAYALNILDVALDVLLNVEGSRLGYDTAAEFYNRYGEDNLRLVVKFEEEEGETMQTFMAKYVLLGNELW